MIQGEKTIRKHTPDRDNEDYQPAGLDLRLKGVEYLEENPDEYLGIYDGKKHLPNYVKMDPILDDYNNYTYVFKRGRYYMLDLGHQEIPEDTVCLYLLRSTLARMGGQLSSSVGDPGYKGTIKVGFTPMYDTIVIQENERVVQAIYLECETGSVYNGDYQHDKMFKAPTAEIRAGFDNEEEAKKFEKICSDVDLNVEVVSH